MLTVKEVHLLIEQGLNSLGIFTEMGNLHEQVDLAVNHVVEKDIRDLKDTPIKQRSALQESILRFLTRNQSFKLVKDGRYFTADIPDNFEELSNSFTLFGLCNCIDDNCAEFTNEYCADCNNDSNKILDKHYYLAKGKVKYDNIWYDDGKIFIGKYGIESAYGEVQKLTTKEKNNITTGIDSLESFSVSSIVKNSFKPLLAWDEKKFYIYYKPYRKIGEVPLELFVNYQSSFSEGMTISWCDERTLGFPSPIQRYYIDLTIAYLAMVNKQDQQNIVNLKSETI